MFPFMSPISFWLMTLFNCFSCNTKGKGAVDLVKAVKNVGFQVAVPISWSLSELDVREETRS